jgi:hypothetical protein
MLVAIHQPQFMPWLGYLDKIDRADLFVVLDCVQFKKQEWQNRNRIRTAEGWQWLTVPVRHAFGQRIDEVRINDAVDWRGKHRRALAMHYARAPHRDESWKGLDEIYAGSWDRLAPLNVAVLRWLMAAFGIRTPLRLSSEMTLREEPTDRLIDICRTVGATRYLAGAGAAGYLDVPKFLASGLELEVQDFHHPVYPQCYEPFVPGMAAVDFLWNCGAEALARLRAARAGAAKGAGEGSERREPGR